jgi:hypothetical protein
MADTSEDAFEETMRPKRAELDASEIPHSAWSTMSIPSCHKEAPDLAVWISVSGRVGRVYTLGQSLTHLQVRISLTPSLACLPVCLHALLLRGH